MIFIIMSHFSHTPPLWLALGLLSLGGPMAKFIADALNDYNGTPDHQANERIAELTDLLTSARAIAERKGESTAWERFSTRLQSAGIGCITAKTFRILPEE